MWARCQNKVEMSGSLQSRSVGITCSEVLSLGADRHENLLCEFVDWRGDGWSSPSFERSFQERLLAFRLPRLFESTVVFGDLSLTKPFEDRREIFIVRDVLLSNIAAFPEPRSR